MTTVAANDNDLQRLQLMQQSGPVIIEKDGQEVAVMVSVAQYEHVRRANAEAAMKAMQEFGEEAQRNGMTQEICDEILAEWDAERKAARAA